MGEGPALRTQLAATEASLRATQEHFRLLVESVRDYAIFLLDPSGRVASWNIGAQRAKGYAASEIIGHHFSEFYPEEDVRAGKCEYELEVAAREGRFEDEGWRKRKDGTLFWANVIITVLRDEVGGLVGFAKVTRDLTDRKRGEDERVRLLSEQKARQAAENANRAKDDFLAHVSHELRTPLNAILGWARLLQSGLDETRRVRATATIERNAEAMRQLIDDLLDVSRIISGRMRLEIDTVDLPLVIERAVESIRLGADAKHIRIHTILDHAVPVMGDASRLQQVVWNLLSNAVKFTPKNGQITVSVRRFDSSVEIAVEDTGAGIPQEKLPLVFDPFWQGEQGASSATRGLGLGLAIVRKLVELHGGHVEARSEGEGRGTTVLVQLPLASVRRSSKADGDPTMEAPAQDLTGLRVLLVEDDDDARDLVQTVLEGAGAVVATARDAKEAMAALTHDVPHIVLSDIGLPGEDGYSLLRRIRALPDERLQRVPAVAMTAFARPDDRMKALSAGFVMHLPKPIEPKEVVMIIAALTSHIPRAR